MVHDVHNRLCHLSCRRSDHDRNRAGLHHGWQCALGDCFMKWTNFLESDETVSLEMVVSICPSVKTFGQAPLGDE